MELDVAPPVRFSAAVYKAGKRLVLELPDFEISWDYPLSAKPDAIRAEAPSKLHETIKGIIERREPLPKPAVSVDTLREDHEDNDTFTAFRIKLPWEAALKMEAYRAWKGSGLTEIALVRATGLSRTGIGNAFKIDMSSEIRGLSLIFEVLGYNVGFTVTKRKKAKK